ATDVVVAQLVLDEGVAVEVVARRMAVKRDAGEVVAGRLVALDDVVVDARPRTGAGEQDARALASEPVVVAAVTDDPVVEDACDVWHARPVLNGHRVVAC